MTTNTNTNLNLRIFPGTFVAAVRESCGGGPILLVKVGKEAEEGVGQPGCPALITATLAAQVSDTHIRIGRLPTQLSDSEFFFEVALNLTKIAGKSKLI